MDTKTLIIAATAAAAVLTGVWAFAGKVMDAVRDSEKEIQRVMERHETRYHPGVK